MHDTSSDDEATTRESKTDQTDNGLLADYAARLAAVEAENERLRERLSALEDSVGARPDDTESNEGWQLSRRGALATLAGLGVAGAASAPATADSGDHLGETWSGDPGNHGLKIDLGSGTPVAFFGGAASPNARALKGHATASSGQTIGVEGKADSPDSIALLGNATASNGVAKGLEGRSAAKFGTGVIGFAKHDTGTTKGVRGLADSPSGRGVEGINTASSGQSIGVRGATDSPDGYGLATPDDARIEGAIDTNETDFVVESGSTNTVDAQSVILGHAMNEVVDGAVGGTVSGGGFDSGSTARRNRVADDYGTVGGGQENLAGDNDGDPTSARYATVGGGESNEAKGDWATVGGGEANTAVGTRTTVAGGGRNDITGTNSNSAIVGGVSNEIQDTSDAFLGGGLYNSMTTGHGGVIGGGWRNSLTESFATIGGGRNNDASGTYATVGGGGSDDDTQGNTASGEGATVPGGRGNTASGNFSFAAGRNATADHDGAVVFGDSSSSVATSQTADEARFQADIAAERSRSVGELGMGVILDRTTVPPNTRTKLEFYPPRFETKGQVDTTDDKYVIDQDGIYLLNLSVGWYDMDIDDYYEVDIENLSTGIIELQKGHEHAGANDTVTVTAIREFSAGDELNVNAEHDGSANRDVYNVNDTSYFEVIHLG